MQTSTIPASYAPTLTPEVTQAVLDAHLTPRPDGRFDVSDTAAANDTWGCPTEGECILQRDHAGECSVDRDLVVDDGSYWGDPYATCRPAWWHLHATTTSLRGHR